MKLMINDLMESHLSTVEIADKYFDFVSPELRNLMSAQLEELRRLYNYKRILSEWLKQKRQKLYLNLLN